MKTNDIIYLGSYPHTEKGFAAPIAFRVLAQTPERFLVISHKCIDARPFHIGGAVSWKNSDIRAILNEAFFYEAFSQEEQMCICRVPVATGRELTFDRVFLLSVQEARHYFRSDVRRQAAATAYAAGVGRWCRDPENCGYWLRDVGFGQAYAADVLPHGMIDPDGDEVYEINGIRPCMWVMRDAR